MKSNNKPLLWSKVRKSSMLALLNCLWTRHQVEWLSIEIIGMSWITFSLVSLAGPSPRLKIISKAWKMTLKHRNKMRPCLSWIKSSMLGLVKSSIKFISNTIVLIKPSPFKELRHWSLKLWSLMNLKMGPKSMTKKELKLKGKSLPTRRLLGPTLWTIQKSEIKILCK